MGSSSINLVSEDGKRISAMMSNFTPSSNPIRIAEVGNGSQPCRLSSDFGILEEESLGGYRVVADGFDANNRRNPISSQLTDFNQGGGSDFRFASLAKLPNNIGSSSTFLGAYENGRDSVSSPRTDTSSDADTDERIQQLDMVQSVSSDRSKGDKVSDQKSLRRLAQNREAARKSRLRKKAYVQQLESSRLKLTQLEQELQKARQQGIFISSSGSDQSHATSGNGGALAFDAEYTRWLEEQNQKINELRAAINSHASDNELCTVVDSVITHFEDVFRLKSSAVKSDVFHILSGMWKTPAERCFMWIGGFRSSELLKLLAGQLEPLTEQQLMGIYNLQQSSQQAEEALSQGMDALQQSLSETLANGSQPSGLNGNVANYMGQMAMAMGKLGTLEGFALQADNLRQHTLQHMHRILTTRQSARALLTIHDYFSRLRALSSLWLARPRE